MDPVKLAEILDILADLSVNGRSYRECLYALKLQVELRKRLLT